MTLPPPQWSVGQRRVLDEAARTLTGIDYDIACVATRLEKAGLGDQAARVDDLMRACIALREEFRRDAA